MKMLSQLKKKISEDETASRRFHYVKEFTKIFFKKNAHKVKI